MKIHLRQDPYRDPPGQDLNGRNIYRVTLTRIQSLEPLVGAEYADVLAFARAECLERLGQWKEAGEAFESAAKAGTSLSHEASDREQWDRRIGSALEGNSAPQTLDAVVAGLDDQIGALSKMSEDKPPAPYESLLKREKESVLSRKASFLFSNRQVLPRGAERALESAQKLADENGESCRRGENLLLLGKFNEDLARDYALSRDPARTGFDLNYWSRFIERARTAYLKVAQSDGDPSKPEGQARLRALDAFFQRTVQQAR